jgi:hypothetical protein
MEMKVPIWKATNERIKERRRLLLLINGEEASERTQRLEKNLIHTKLNIFWNHKSLCKSTKIP